MTELPEFISFGKIARLNKEIIITEKIDGTNAQVYVDEKRNVFAGSRSQWITPENDNHGFAKWVEENKTALSELGPGRHYGEWAGLGINRNYGMQQKTFYLFNTGRWRSHHIQGEYLNFKAAILPPKCCDVVPVLYKGLFSDLGIKRALLELAVHGSKLNKFNKPEGIVIYHVAANRYFKVTIENDNEYKSKTITLT
jgi:hypothetical protein